jgi:hypothetical protein
MADEEKDQEPDDVTQARQRAEVAKYDADTAEHREREERAKHRTSNIGTEQDKSS